MSSTKLTKEVMWFLSQQKMTEAEQLIRDHPDTNFNLVFQIDYDNRVYGFFNPVEFAREVMQTPFSTEIVARIEFYGEKMAKSKTLRRRFFGEPHENRIPGIAAPQAMYISIDFVDV